MDLLSFVLVCHLMLFRPLTFFFFNNHGIRKHKNLMLKQFHVFGRGNVVDALKSEKSQKENTEAPQTRVSFPLPLPPSTLF